MRAMRVYPLEKYGTMTLYDTHPAIIKTITVATHPWKTYPDFDAETIFARSITMWEAMAERGFGPRVYRFEETKDQLNIIQEYLPTRVTRQWIVEHDGAVRAFIDKLHRQGYYHGDLHGGNLRLNVDGELRMVNFETMFSMFDLQSTDLVTHWAREAFDMSEVELTNWEATGNYRTMAGEYDITDEEVAEAAARDHNPDDLVTLPPQQPPNSHRPIQYSPLVAELRRLRLSDAAIEQVVKQASE